MKYDAANGRIEGKTDSWASGMSEEGSRESRPLQGP
jgi:hypothetical protein